MSRIHEAPTVNAGSMADIAFLLLIFFLVTTTIEKDKGIEKVLPPLHTENGHVQERNLLRITLNDKDELMIGDEIGEVAALRKRVVAFLDNGGALEGSRNFCEYCQGEHLGSASENPKKAIIAFAMARETGYGVYITVQNEMQGAYNDLRNREAQRIYGLDYVAIKEQYQSPDVSDIVKSVLKERINKIRAMYPQRISETTINQLY